MGKIRTLNGICKILKAEGFKRYAKDYGNSRVVVEKSVLDAIYILESYRCDESLIDHFNAHQESIYCEYRTGYTPFYKTDAFKKQNRDEIKEFGYIVSM